MLYTVACSDISFVIRIIAKLIKYIHFLVPILLIVLVIVDFAKLIIGNVDDKAKKDATSKMLTRVIYAVIIFLLPTIIFFIFDKIEGFDGSKDSHSDVTATSWYTCFRSAYNE